LFFIFTQASHNIGTAIDTQDGLIVPNVKNVQSLSMFMNLNEDETIQHITLETQIQENIWFLISCMLYTIGVSVCVKNILTNI
jgi:hypothetical protein